MAAKSRYLIIIKSGQLTPELLDSRFETFFADNTAYIVYETARVENQMQFAAEYAQQLKYVLKTKKHVTLDELTLVQLFTPEEAKAVYGANKNEAFHLQMFRVPHRMQLFEESILKELYSFDLLPAVYAGSRKYLGCIPCVIRRDCGSLDKIAHEMSSMLTHYVSKNDGQLTAPFSGKIVYSSLYEYERKKS